MSLAVDGKQAARMTRGPRAGSEFLPALVRPWLAVFPEDLDAAEAVRNPPSPPPLARPGPL